jgi:sugar/nucleoside kinase (ribokinase family)
MFTANTVFFAPAYPLEDVFDPTGAGDSFAGGFIGYLARAGKLDETHLRRAVVHGSVMGSFAVERFSIQRLMEIGENDIKSRLEDFRRLVAFEEEMTA